MEPAGRRDRRVTFQRQVAPLRLASGQVDPQSGWTELARRWGRMSVEAGAEQDMAGQETSRHIVTMRVPFLAGLRTTDRALYDGEVWDILEVTEVGRREELDVRMRTHNATAGAS